MKRAGSLAMTEELLKEMLGVRNDIRISAVRHDAFTGIFEFLFEGDGMPQAYDGVVPRRVEYELIFKDK